MKQSAWQTVMGILLLGTVVLISWQAGALVSVQNHKAGADKTKLAVVIDTGHGGNDPGKVGISGQLEKDINLKTIQRLKGYLGAADVEVVLTRDSDQELYNSGDSHKKMADMRRRCEVIDEVNPGLVVSTHQNSYREGYVSGGQVLYYKTSKKGKYLAEFLQKRLDYVLGEASKRLARVNDSYYFLLRVEAPIVIAEYGFLSNSKEAACLEEEDYQDRVVWTIHMRILQYPNTVGNQIAKQ